MKTQLIIIGAGLVLIIIGVWYLRSKAKKKYAQTDFEKIMGDWEK